MAGGKTGADMIFQERARQIAEEGWTPDHDDAHNQGELVEAALAYALYPKSAFLARVRHLRQGGAVPTIEATVPFDDVKFFEKMKKKTKVRRLVIAGALIAAEIDRLLREEAFQAEKKAMEDKLCRKPCGDVTVPGGATATTLCLRPKEHLGDCAPFAFAEDGLEIGPSFDGDDRSVLPVPSDDADPTATTTPGVFPPVSPEVTPKR